MNEICKVVFHFWSKGGVDGGKGSMSFRVLDNMMGYSGFDVINCAPNILDKALDLLAERGEITPIITPISSFGNGYLFEYLGDDMGLSFDKENGTYSFEFHDMNSRPVCCWYAAERSSDLLDCLVSIEVIDINHE